MHHERVLRDHLVTQKLQGVQTGQLIKTDPHVADNGQSGICSVSAYGQFEWKRAIPSSKKTTDDKIVIGYTSQGLPFQIVVDGFYGGETALTFDFIDQHVVPLMNAKAKELSVASDADETIQSLIRTIFELRQQHAQHAEFTMAVGITYEKNGSLYCAGFGVGDCGLVLKARTGEQTQLAHNTEIHTKRHDIHNDGFSRDSQTKMGTVIQRNSVFSDIRVERGDELMGYTFIFPEWKTKVDEKLSGDETVYRFKLPGTTVGEGQSLCALAITRTQEQYAKQCERALEKEEATRFGDDATFGTVRIPEADWQAKLAGEIATPNADDNTAHWGSETLKTQLRDIIYHALPTAKKPIGQKPAGVHTGFSLFKVQFHCHRAALLSDAMLKAPSKEACLDLIEHQLSFYTMNKGEFRAPLPAWVPANTKKRLEQDFHYRPFKGKNGYFALLENLKAVAKGEDDPDASDREEESRSRGCGCFRSTSEYVQI
jgi:hypothetical protein